MFTITLNRVRDRITVKEGQEKLNLVVDSDSTAMVTKIRKSQESMTKLIRSEATDEERNEAARTFSEAIFGEEQTDKLIEFYQGDYSCVATICGIYFEKRLCKKITKAQKKIK